MKRSIDGEDPALPAVAAERGWAVSNARVTEWKPHYAGFASERIQKFQRAGRDVTLYLAYYRRQEKGRELVTSSNELVTMDDWKWKLTARGRDRVDWLGQSRPVDEAELSGPRARLRVFRMYWVAGSITASEPVAKLLTAWSILTGRGDDSALILMYATQPVSPDEARNLLRGFAAEMSPAIERALMTAHGGPG